MVVGIERGHKLLLSVSAGELTSHKVQLPIVSVGGIEPGPTLSITAGMHATEYVAISAAHKLAQTLDPEKIKGNVLIAPLVNRYGFDSASLRVNPIDNENLNRIFPGDPGGSISFQMAHSLFNEVISKSDYYIDLHGGELGESLVPFAVRYLTHVSEVDNKCEELLRAFGFKYVWQPSDSGENLDSSEEAQNGYAITQASKRNIPSFIAEGGTEGKLDLPMVDFLYQGVLNVMMYLDMIDGKPKLSDLVLCNSSYYVHAHKSGVAYLNVRAGDTVEPDQKIAEIRSLTGDLLESVVSPISAYVVSSKFYPIVKNQDYLFLLLKIPS